MKVKLTDNARKDLVAYRIERSHETLREVDCLIEGRFYNAAVSRLYYACYYILVALLVANKLETLTHAGVKSMFSLHFIKTGLVDKELSKTFFNLFDLRHNNDYEDFCFCDHATITEYRPLAEQFITNIEELISQTAN